MYRAKCGAILAKQTYIVVADHDTIMTQNRPHNLQKRYRITQQLQQFRAWRRVRLWQTAQLPQRRHLQQITRLGIRPLLVVAAVATLYLALQATVMQPPEFLIPLANSVQIAPTGVRQAVQVSLQGATSVGTASTAQVITSDSHVINQIVIPTIQLNSPVIEVGWDSDTDTTGQPIVVWQVARYAVGHHYTSAHPGQANNIVLSGHVGGYGSVFRSLDRLRPNDQIMLISGTRVFEYVVQQQILVEEQHASPSEQIANLSYIDDTQSEMLTLITCWPPTGVDRFSQRLIIRALPYARQP